jgi:hypothetical protein
MLPRPFAPALPRDAIYYEKFHQSPLLLPLFLFNLDYLQSIYKVVPRPYESRVLSLYSLFCFSELSFPKVWLRSFLPLY